MVRDDVDYRRNAGVLFLLPPWSTSSAYSSRTAGQGRDLGLWLTVLLLLIIVTTVIGLRIRKLMRQRYPDSWEPVPRLIVYGAKRAHVRRWRMPGPAVEVGAAI